MGYLDRRMHVVDWVFYNASAVLSITLFLAFFVSFYRFDPNLQPQSGRRFQLGSFSYLHL